MPFDLALLDQYLPPQKRAQTRTDIIKPFQDVADLNSTRGQNDTRAFDLARAKHDADLGDQYRELLRSHDPNQENDLADLRQQGFGPEVIPQGNELVTRGEKAREFNANDEERRLLREGNEDFKRSQTTNMEAQRTAEAAKLEAEKNHWKEQNALEWWKAQHPQKSGLNTLGLTPGERALDIAFGKDNQDFIGGGFSDAQKGLVELQDIQKRLAGDKSAGVKPEKLTGRNSLGIPMGWVPNWAQSQLNPEALDAKERVENIVQRNLRPILGAQFTENEGKRLIERAYNPSLSPKQNADRLQRLSIQMKKALDAKAEQSAYFEQNGTLKGFDASKYFSPRSSEDFNLDEAPAANVGQLEHPNEAPITPKLDNTAWDAAYGTQEDAKLNDLFKKHKKAK